MLYGKTDYLENINCFVDLHIHLDGSISEELARELAEIAGVNLPDDPERLSELLHIKNNCNDLNEFLDKFALPCSLLQNYECVKRAVKNLCNEMKNEGVMYAEIRFAPQKCTEKGMSQMEAVKAAIEGMRQSDLDGNIILCCMRGGSFEENMETVKTARHFLGKGVCAIDLAGAEALFPTSEYKDIFKKASDEKIPFTIHAGEAAGYESVNAAIDFGAVRIGHGVRASEDEATLKRLKELEIPLEFCPTSNINTSIYGSFEELPLPKLLEAGIRVTVNTDDPSIEGTTIRKEFQKLIKTFSLTPSDIKGFLINAVEASFASRELKAIMRERIVEAFTQVKEQDMQETFCNIGIIGAMSKEVEKMVDLLEDKKSENISGIWFTEGRINGKNVVVAQCGIGKVFAAVCAQTMILKYKPEKIINIGVGGSLTDELRILDVAIAEQVVQYDMDTSAIGDPIGLISGINRVYFDCDGELCENIKRCLQERNIKYKTGVIATGDRFLSSTEVKNELVKRFGAIACDMEGGSIGHVCFINNVGFGIIRAISDMGDENSGEDYGKLMERACNSLFEVVKAYLFN